MPHIDFKGIFGWVRNPLPPRPMDYRHKARKFLKTILTDIYYVREMGITTYILERALTIEIKILNGLRMDLRIPR